MTRSEEINEFMLTTLKEHGIEATAENRLAFLQGMQDEWLEVSDPPLEQILYMSALSSEIFKLRMELMFPRAFA